jgi:hypothetical protein
MLVDMAVPELSLAKLRRFCDQRTPADMSDQMRLEATTRGNSVTLADCRPPWDGASSDWTRLPFAQLRYQPDNQLWTLYWADRNDRWHLYEGLDSTTDLDALIREIDDDPTCIFFG